MDYRHGGDIYGRHKIAVDFSVNTNPLGMPESVKNAVSEQAEKWSIYPDSKCRNLRKRLAEFYNKQYCGKFNFMPADFLCGNGAADLLYSLIFALRPRKALLFAPSFGEYEEALQAVGCEVKKIYLKETADFSLPDSAGELLEEINVKPDMLIIGNPNNPTGGVLTSGKIRELAYFCLEKNIFFVVDECFNWFLDDGEKYSAAPLIGEFKNLLVLNAFTKIYAMAGLRLGMALCRNASVTERIERCRQPWSVSGPATAAGIQALAEEQFLSETKKLLASEREFLKSGLESLGFKVYPSKANYLLFRRKNEVDYFKLCRERGILIRSCESFDGLDGSYYRVSVKQRAENEMLLSCLGCR